MNTTDCICEPQDRYVHHDEFVQMHAEGFCSHCLKRAIYAGDWAECPCCHKRWRLWDDGDGYNLVFNHDFTRRRK
jgi:hypothetical protein